MDKGLIYIASALCTSEFNKCNKCYCSEECDAVGGETMCGQLRLFYINKMQ